MGAASGETRAGRSPGGAEIVFPADDAAAVGAVYDDWRTRGVAIAQEPTKMDFGTTFVGLDPDGHRLRVFAPFAQ